MFFIQEIIFAQSFRHLLSANHQFYLLISIIQAKNLTNNHNLLANYSVKFVDYLFLFSFYRKC